MTGSWLDEGEHELGIDGEAFLQGVVLAEVSGSKHTVATERRVVMLDEVDSVAGRGARNGIFFDVGWASVRGYWRGVLGFPAELWREGPEGEVTVLMLDPEAADGQDVVIRSNLNSWVAAIRGLSIPEIVD
ncbi:MAG: hypothetical protein ACR2G7_12915 [Acidimicrobiales bacterium]